MQDLTSILPNGKPYEFWEKDCDYPLTLHVDGSNPAASDDGDGSERTPLKTIGRAAEIAVPGTRILIHEGIYRECVSPAMGGTDPEHMISYEAFGSDHVVISASEEVRDFCPSTGWKLMRLPEFSEDGKTRSAVTAARADAMEAEGSCGEADGSCKEANGSCEETDSGRKKGSPQIYRHDLDPDMFRGYNPFCAVNILHDRLFIEYGKTDMTTYLNRRGCVFSDGEPLKQVPLYFMLGDEDNTYWVEANGQVIHFRLKGDADPRDHRIEITVREQCFAPKKPFLSYIRVKGLICEHAATGAPVPQRGAISSFRGHHWIIENCTVNWSNALAIDIGNECWHHEYIEGQVIGWSVIRGCVIRDAGVCGIAGLFAEHMLIEDNLIEGTGWQKMELSWEAAGIKLHNSIDGLIRRNVIRNTFRADHLWLDCGNVNTRITSNLFLDGIEQREAVFIECTKEGVNLIDNNIIWNVEGRFDPADIPSEPGSTGWYKLKEHDVANGYGIYCEGTDRLIIAANLIGKCRHSGFYAKPVSFRMGGLERGGTSRRFRILNNIFCDCSEAAVVFPTPDNEADGNLYLCMKGGYLRVMYPAPELCLDLETWREFCGFDTSGSSFWFDFELDREAMSISLIKRADAPMHAPGPAKPAVVPRDPASVRAVQGIPEVPCDFTGKARSAQTLPGPFSSWDGVISLSDGIPAAKA